MTGCPKCSGQETRVINSRQSADGIRRRRECPSCGHRWSTMEIDKERWDRAKRLLDHRSRGGRISTAKKRGFEVPDEHRAEYRRLRRNKNLTPREAGQVLGLI